MPLCDGAVVAGDARPVEHERDGLAVQRHVHQQLVEGPVEERRVDGDHGVQTRVGQPRGRGERVLLGDADVDAPLRERLGERREPGGPEHRRRDRDDVLPHSADLDELVGEHAGPADARRRRRQAGDRVEGGRAVHLLGDVVLRGRIAAALLRDDVHDHRAAEAPGAAQRGLDGGDAVAVDRPEVLDAEVGEQLLRRERVLHPRLDRVQRRVERAADHRGAGERLLALLQHALVAGLQPQRRQPVGHAADRRGVGAAVVVDDDDEVAVLGRGDVVQRLPGHAAGERAVADHRDDVAALLGERVAPRDAVGPGQRRGGVAVLDVVVRALRPARVARRAAGELEPLPAVVPAGEQLVHVRLVAGVPDQVSRGESNTRWRAIVSSTTPRFGPRCPPGARDARHQLAADLGGQRVQPLGIQKPQVGRGCGRNGGRRSRRPA